MFGIDKLKAYFHEAAQASKARAEAWAARKTLGSAIWQGDAGAVKRILETIADKEGFMQDYEGYNEAMGEAIRAGNMDIFKALYEYGGNPNFLLCRDEIVSLRGSVRLIFHFSLLYKALQEHKPNIAELLAADPRTDITKGFLDRGVEKQSPLELAAAIMRNGGGMEKVVSILSKRTAELKREEAQKLDRQADGAGTLPPAPGP